MRSFAMCLVVSVLSACAHVYTVPQGTHCAQTYPALRTHLKQYGIAFEKLKGKDRCGVRVIPGIQSPLNRFAADLATMAATSLVYDLAYFASHPDVTAAYLHSPNELMLPNEVIASGNPQHWELLHELGHVETAVLKRDGHWSPYHGVLIGEAFPRGDLDEIRAYASDLKRAERHADPAEPASEWWGRVRTSAAEGKKIAESAVIALDAVADALKYGKEAKMQVVNNVHIFSIETSADFGAGASVFTLILEMSDLPIQTDWDPSPLLKTRVATMLQMAKNAVLEFSAGSTNGRP